MDDFSWVKMRFAEVGLLDKDVHFIKGYFARTFPSVASDSSITILRMDGDIYSSNAVAPRCFYSRLSTGSAIIIINDYNWGGSHWGYKDRMLCKEAVDDFRWHFGVRERIIDVGVVPGWRKKE